MTDLKLLTTPQTLLNELVAIPSLNPEDTEDLSLVGEGRVAAFLKSWFEARGFSVELTMPEPDRPNLIARFGPADGRVLLIEGHMDTVGVGGMVVPPFTLTEKEGRLYGRGACDTKGPIAAALAALDGETLAFAAQKGVQVVYAGAYGEEKSCKGADAFAASGLTADVALVLEPTGNQPVIGHKGCVWLEVESTGRSCHGSRPEEGDNAIDRLMRVINAAHAVVAQGAGDPDPLLGPPTVNVGLISGGKAPNVVPDAASVTLDFRVLPGVSAESVIEDLSSQLDPIDCDALTFSLIAERPAFVTPEDSLGVRAACEAIARVGRDPKVSGTTWFSDAGPLSANVNDIFVFGPGDISQAHTIDEWIDVEELNKGAEIIRHWIAAWVASVG